MHTLPQTWHPDAPLGHDLLKLSELQEDLLSVGVTASEASPRDYIR